MAKSRQLQKSYRSTRETPTEVLDLIEKSEIPFSKLVDQSIVCYMNLERDKNGEAPVVMTSSSGGDMTPVFDAIHSDGEMTRDMLRDINNKVKVLAKYMKKSVIEQRQEHDADEHQHEIATTQVVQSDNAPADVVSDVPDALLVVDATVLVENRLDAAHARHELLHVRWLDGDWLPKLVRIETVATAEILCAEAIAIAKHHVSP